MAKSNKAEDLTPVKALEPAKSETPKASMSVTQAALPTVTAAAVKTRKFPSRLMYMGPSMTENGVIFQHGQIFSNGLPETWKEKALLEPEFFRLLVPVDRVGKAMTELGNPASALSVAHRKVESAHRARRKQAKEGK